MNSRRANHRTLTQIFAIPLLIAVISSAGLVSALVGDGWWDAVSWMALGIAPLLYLILIWRRKPN